MTDRLLTHLRHVDLAVPDLERQREFFTGTWGLTQQHTDGDVAYRLAQRVKSVKIEAIAGSKVVRTLKGGTAKGKTYRFKLPARLAKRGQSLKIRVT